MNKHRTIFPIAIILIILASALIWFAVSAAPGAPTARLEQENAGLDPIPTVVADQKQEIEMPIQAPKPSHTAEPSLPFNPRTGFIPPDLDLSHLTGQMPETAAPQALPTAFDWRNVGGVNYVTSIKDQADCGSCYAFASVANFESRLLIDSAGTFDFSENHAKECNWRALNGNFGGMGSCQGGNYFMIANLFSQKGTVLETCDPYQASDVACKSTCPYQKTLLDWRIISGSVVPNADVLKQYIYTYGPVYVSMYADDTQGFNNTYTGAYTFNYIPASGSTNHAVLIVGWSDNLPHVPGSSSPATGWIVKNSWGTGWGANGYFYITYGAANIGKNASFVKEWQNYDNTGSLLYYDDNGWSAAWGYGDTTAWGLVKFVPSADARISRVEFWTTDITTDVDVYLYDTFNGSTPSVLLASKLNLAFSEAGYHSVQLDSPIAVSAGNDVYAVVKFTNSAYTYPVPVDTNGPYETGKTYLSHTGGSGSWVDMGASNQADIGIRLRTIAKSSANYRIYAPVILKQPIVAPLCNGDFEQGHVCWTEYSTHGWEPIINSGFPGTVTPRSGSWLAWLGGDYDDTSNIQQQATVASGTPYLAYYHWIASADSCGYDFAKVLVNGTTVVTYDLCSSQNTGGWVKKVVNLSAYNGQTVTIQIRVETDSVNNSNLFVDDVAFQSSALAVENIFGQTAAPQDQPWLAADRRECQAGACR